jgi:hypothetical protein
MRLGMLRALPTSRGSYSAFGVVLAERRPANLITLCDSRGIDLVTVTGQILILRAVRRTGMETQELGHGVGPVSSWTEFRLARRICVRRISRRPGASTQGRRKLEGSDESPFLREEHA